MNDPADLARMAERIQALAALDVRWARVSTAFDWLFALASAFTLAWWFDTAADRSAMRFLVFVIALACTRNVALRLLAVPLVDVPMERVRKRWGRP